MDFYLFKYLHFIGIFGVVGALAIEWIVTKKELSADAVSLLSKVDAVYGVSSVVVLSAGFVLWFGVGKPAEFYSTNGLLYLKIVLFAIIGGLSIYPSIFFFKNRKIKSGIVHVPNVILTLIKIEIALLLLIPLLATYIADGRSTLF